MKKLYHIILDNNVDSSYIHRMTNELGNTYKLYQNNFFLYSEMGSAHDLYDRLITDEYSQTGIVICEIPLEGFSYWGYSDKGLWTWLSLIVSDFKNRGSSLKEFGENI